MKSRDNMGASVLGALIIAFIIACLLIDLFPHHGPPNFRYTGCDPERDVWNFGWPLASIIYDS